MPRPRKQLHIVFSAVILVFAMLLSLSACGAPSSRGSDPENEETAEARTGISILPAFGIQIKIPEIPPWQVQGRVSVDAGSAPAGKRHIRIDLCAIGDVMAHNGTYEAAYDGQTYDFDYMFAEIAKYIVSADYSVGNLETVFAGKDRVYSNYPMFNTPEQMGQSLSRVLGLDLLSLANNHILDRGYSGLETTLDFLDEYGIAHTGAYTSQEDYDTPFIADIGGARVAFISSTYGVNSAVPKDHPYAVRVTSQRELAKASQAAVDAGADCVVALLHWGVEYRTTASDQQRELAKWLFENTAISLIIGNHPHVVEPAEAFDVQYNGQPKRGVVLYALGNFTGEQLKDYRDGGILSHITMDIVPGAPEKSQVLGVTYTPTFIDPNPKASGRRYRVISIYDAIYGYETGADPLISEKEYKKMLEYRDYFADMFSSCDLVSEYVIAP